MITYQNSERKARARRERKSIQVRLAPSDYRLFSDLCEEAGRSFGEQVALWLQERTLRQQQEARQGAQ